MKAAKAAATKGFLLMRVNFLKFARINNNYGLQQTTNQTYI